MRLLILPLLVGLLVVGEVRAQEVVTTAEEVVPESSMNRLVLEAVRAMPTGGVYRADRGAFQNLADAVTVDGGHLTVEAAGARPSFCSSATYLVFAHAIGQWSRDQRVALPAGTLDALLVRGQPDGTGVWGCWNANGPGTARLFYLLGLGRNFTSFEQAQPGDFMKIFWNEHIGAKERGHSVVYLGRERGADGVEYVKYWSSNQPNGYGVARVPRTKIKRVLFSRLESPAALARLKGVPKDRYLASMLNTSSSEAEMLKMTGVSR